MNGKKPNMIPLYCRFKIHNSFIKWANNYCNQKTIFNLAFPNYIWWWNTFQGIIDNMGTVPFGKISTDNLEMDSGASKRIK